MCLTLGVQMGFPTAIDGRLDRIGENMATLHPTFVCAVPRIFQQARAKIIRKALSEGGAKAAIFKRAVDVGLAVVRRRQAGRPVGLLLEMQYRVADRLVFSKIRARFGRRLKFFFCGSVALPRGLSDFFSACGIVICEGYGLTESAAMTFFNRPWANRVGTVGTILPGMEVKTAGDGEVLLRGPGILRGYRGLPEDTAAAIDAEGWFHTGDIGVLDADGTSRDHRPQEGPREDLERQVRRPGARRGTAHARDAAHRECRVPRRGTQLRHRAPRALRGGGPRVGRGGRPRRPRTYAELGKNERLLAQLRRPRGQSERGARTARGRPEVRRAAARVERRDAAS